MYRLTLLLCLAAPAALGQAAYEVTVPTGALNGAALAHFERGVELLHSFEYDDARDAFRDAQRLAPTAVMPVWGEAMTHNHPVWQRQETDNGRAVLERFDARGSIGHDDGAAAGDLTRQASYLRAVRALFTEMEDMGKEDRDDLYLGHLARHVDRFPDDRDGRAFYALALLGSAHEGRDYDVYGRAAEVAQSVLDEDPEHPGALHYLIHAYDDPDHAALALPAARAYSEIVSAASHALHMPTHIYFALGLWDEASALNVRAFEAARDASARRGEPLNNHGWHALWWLGYSELQRDSTDRAAEIFDRARRLYDVDSSRLALAHLVRIRAQLVSGAETARRPWRELVGEWEELPRDRMSAATRAADLLAESIARPSAASRADSVVAQANRLLSDETVSASVRATALMARAMSSDMNDPSLYRGFAEAVDLIDASPIAFGPPSPATFPHESLSAVYMLAGRPDLSLCLIERVLARAPNRRMALELQAAASSRVEQFRSLGARPGAAELLEQLGLSPLGVCPD